MGSDRWADKGNLQMRFELFHSLSQLEIIVEADMRSKEYDEIVLYGDLRRLFRADVMRGCIEQSGNSAQVADHCRGIGEPDGIPITLDLSRRRPTRTGAAIELFK